MPEISRFYGNGKVYGGEPKGSIKVKKVKALDDKIMLITFSNGETRLFDARDLIGEVYEPLNDISVFSAPEIEHGVVTWADGSIDCAPEFMYEHSYKYAVIA